MKKYVFGVDVGGTTVKMGLFNVDGEVLDKWEIKTRTENGGEAILPDIAASALAKLEEKGIAKEEVSGVGFGVPGPVTKEGVIQMNANLGWRDKHVAKELGELTGLPCMGGNDVKTAGLGEMWKGAGSGAKDLVCITLGTGVGGGVIVNGSLVSGANGAAGEIGHLTVVTEKGFRCNCGKTGCLETVASATGFVNLAMEHLDEHPESKIMHIHKHNGYITAKDVIDSAKENDPYATEILNRVSFYLGMSLANVANVLNPEKIVIGGGVSKAGSILLENVRRFFEEYSFIRVKKSTQLSIATLGNDAGVIGAAWLVKSRLNE